MSNPAHAPGLVWRLIMTIKKISAIGAAALLACGIWVWSFAQAPKHTPSANGAAAVSGQTAAPVNPAANAAPQPAASVNMAAAGPSPPQDCAAPARPKPRAKPKIYRPQALAAPVAVAPPPPIYSQPVYSPPVVVMPSPMVVGGMSPYYGYRRYPVYYSSYAPRYWAYGGPRLAYSGSRWAYGGSYGGWPHRHRR